MRPLDDICHEILNKPVSPRASLLLIRRLKEEGELDMVAKACLKALEFFPDDIDIRRVLAETYIEQGSIELAEEELTRLCERLTELSSIFKLQADLFVKLDRTKEAVDCLRLYLAHHGSDKEAAQLLSRLMSPRKEEPSILPTATLAEIYYKQGDLEEAIRIYEQTVKAFPGDEKAKKRLWELREKKEAGEHGKPREDQIRQGKLKLITVLERWLTNLRQTGALDPLRQP